MEPQTAFQVLKQGGDWLGALRARVQRTFHNGETITWGGSDVLRPAATIQQVEELAAVAVATDRARLMPLLKECEAYLCGQYQASHGHDPDWRPGSPVWILHDKVCEALKAAGIED